MPTATFLGITKFMLKLVHEVDTSIPMVIIGAEYPKDADDFVKYASLAKESLPARLSDEESWYFCEITCYSKHADQRKIQNEQGNLHRQFEFAQAYFDLVNQKDYKVETSLLRFHEARMINLDLNSLGQNASPFAQTSPKMNLNAIVIEAKAQIFKVR